MRRGRRGSFGFTLLELLVVVVLIGLLAVTALVLFNPIAQIQKGWDARRKQDFTLLQQTLEDFYNDKGHFPIGADICYDAPTSASGVCTCHICGLKGTQSLAPYLSRLPCNPQTLGYDYVYQYDCPNATSYSVCAAMSTGVTGIASAGQDASSCYLLLTPTP